MPKRNNKALTRYTPDDFRRSSKSLQCRRKWKKRKPYTRGSTKSLDRFSIDGVLDTSFNFDPDIFNQFNSSREDEMNLACDRSAHYRSTKKY